jgi:protein-S-isoprenylcysteine O-methyltransferase Ste14
VTYLISPASIEWASVLLPTALRWTGVGTRREEDRLVARFGDHYREYMTRAGRFLPRWGSRR